MRRLSGASFGVEFQLAVRNRTCQLVELHLLQVEGELGSLQDLFPQLQSARGVAQTLEMLKIVNVPVNALVAPSDFLHANAWVFIRFMHFSINKCCFLFFWKHFLDIVSAIPWFFWNIFGLWVPGGPP